MLYQSKRTFSINLSIIIMMLRSKDALRIVPYFVLPQSLASLLYYK